MRRCHALRLALCACGLAIAAMPVAAQAVPAAAPGTVAAVAAASAPAEPAPARRAPEPNVQRIVSEDDNVRIEELRVRGQTREIVVHHKAVAGSRYEILPGQGGRDPSTQDKRSGGQSVWRLFSF